MGSCDEVTLQTKLKSQDEKNQEEAISGNFHNSNEVKDGSQKEAKDLSENVMDDVTIGEESHVVVQADENCHLGTGNENIDFSPSQGGCGVGGVGDVGDNGSIPSNDVVSKEKVSDKDLDSTADDSGLKGAFFVVTPSTEDDEGDLQIDKDSNVFEKTLTLTVCSPKPIFSSSENHESEESTVTTAAAATAADHDSDQNEKNSDEINLNKDESSREVDTTTESEKIHNTIMNETNHDIKSESATHDGPSHNGSNNVDGKNQVHFRNQATGQRRTNIKHNKTKNRSKLQETVPEIDETAGVLKSVMRANEATSHNRDNSINPKTSWKRQNKSSVGCKHSTKDDFPFQFSQTKNSSTNGGESNLPTSKLTHQSVSRLHLGHSDGEQVNKGGVLHSVLSNIPNVYESHSRQQRLSPCNSPGGDLSSPRRGRFTSIFERKYTKKELQRALPRKSFFNCHEKAMKDAGLQVEDSASKRKAERLKAKLERIAREFDPLPSKVVLGTKNENSEINPKDERGGISILVTDVESDVPNSLADEDTDHQHKGNVSEDPTDVRMSADINIHSTGKKKRLHPEKSDYIDCKPLVHYLEYVRDNQVEYENHLTTTQSNTKDKPINRLISMGKAFELRHRGGANTTKENDVMVMAAKALRPRTSDASRYYKQDNEKSGHRGQDPTLRQARPPSDDKRRQEKSTSGGITAKDDEHHAKTELEKKKLKAEEWAMSVSTNTLTRAKIQSLRELGGDDEELSKWWVALRKCCYLRSFMTESV